MRRDWKAEASDEPINRWFIHWALTPTWTLSIYPGFSTRTNKRTQLLGAHGRGGAEKKRPTPGGTSSTAIPIEKIFGKFV